MRIRFFYIALFSLFLDQLGDLCLCLFLCFESNDFGEVVQKIKWSKWTVNGAEGVGEYSLNDCEPDCADGTFRSVPVKVYLNDLRKDGKSYFFNTLTFTLKDGYLVPATYETRNGLIFSGNTVLEGKEIPAITWDLASFYREVPGMRTALPKG